MDYHEEVEGKGRENESGHPVLLQVRKKMKTKSNCYFSDLSIQY